MLKNGAESWAGVEGAACLAALLLRMGRQRLVRAGGVAKGIEFHLETSIGGKEDGWHRADG